MCSTQGCETFLWCSFLIMLASLCWLVSAACWFGVYVLVYAKAEVKAFAKETFNDCSG